MSTYYELNKQKVLKKASKYRKANKEAIAKRNLEYRINNSDIVTKGKKKYNEKNKDKIRTYQKEYFKQKRQTNDLFKLKTNIMRSISRAFESTGIKKTNKTNDILGCSYEEFKYHIEKQFEIWMNWNNYGPYKINEIRTWQVDHIKPISLAKTKEDIILLNHYTNLRPLCSKKNLEKSNRLL